MALKAASKVQRFEAVVLFNGVAEALKVFVLKVDLVKAFVDGRNVLGLDGLEERSDEVVVTSSLHDLDSLGQVNLHGDKLEEVVQEERLFFEVEDHSTVVEVVVGNVDNVLGENVVSPGAGRVLHHGEDSLILLVVNGVEVDSLRPHLVLFASTNELGNEELLGLGVGTDVIHKSGRLVLGEKDSEVSVDTVVSSFEAHASFQKGDEFFPVAELLVVLNNFFEMVGVDNDVGSTESGHSEFLSSDTGETDRFPDLRDVGLLGSIVSSLVLLEHYIGVSELVVVLDSLEKNLSRQVKFVVEATVSTGEDVSLVGLVYEGLKIRKESFSTHSVSKDKFGVNSLLLLVPTGHQQVSNDLLIVVLLGRQVDNSVEVVSISSLDEGIDGLVEVTKLELSLGQLKPDFGLVGLVSKFGGELDVLNVFNEDVDGFDVLTKLLVDAKSFFVKLVLGLSGNVS